jgi:hypothetical protein
MTGPAPYPEPGSVVKGGAAMRPDASRSNY